MGPTLAPVRHLTVLLGAVATLALPTFAPAATPSPSGWSNLFRVAQDGRRLVELAPESDYYRRLAGSPAGDEFAFTTADGLWITNGRPGAARLISADGDNPDGTGVQELAWSGNGRRVVLGACVNTAIQCVPNVIVVDVATGRRTTFPFAADSPSLSGDGQKVLVRIQRTGFTVLATPDGHILRRFDGVEDARFAPRGHLVAYSNPRHQLCLMHDDGRRRRCSRSQGLRPIWSADGSTIAFQMIVSDGAAWRVAVMKTKGNLRPQPVTAEEGWGGGPMPRNTYSLSRDGRVLATSISRDMRCLHVVSKGRNRCVRQPGAGPCAASETAFTRNGEIVFSSVCVGYRS
jgi:Tol biopolymer transport system component